MWLDRCDYTVCYDFDVGAALWEGWVYVLFYYFWRNAHYGYFLFAYG